MLLTPDRVTVERKEEQFMLPSTLQPRFFFFLFFLVLDKVANLMDDLQNEKESHHKAQVSLDQKSREVDAMRRDLDARDAEVRQARADLRSRTERLDVKTREVEQKDAELQEQAARLAEQAARLAALEAESRDAHREKVELAARIQEMQREKEAEDVDAEITVGNGEVDVSTRGPSEEGSGAEEKWAGEKQKLVKELERATAGIQLKSRQLEAVNARVSIGQIRLGCASDCGLPCLVTMAYPSIERGR